MVDFKPHIRVVGLSEDKDLPLLPTEVWRMIFAKLGPMEYHSCMNTCQAFHNELYEGREQNLFPLVVDDLARWLPDFEIIKLRLVCKSWKQAVDGYSEKYPYGIKKGCPTETLSNAESNAFQNEVTLSVQFTTAGQIEQFMVDMACTKWNPFFGRRLAVNCMEPEYDGFHDSLNHLLSKFGDQIWSFKILVTSGLGLCQCLSKMPNLRAIQTEYSVDTDEHQMIVADYVGSNPVGSFPKLEILIVKTYEHDALAETLARQYAPQLRMLSICTPFFALNNPAPQLTIAEFIAGRCYMSALEYIANIHPPLTKLQIYVDEEGNQPVDPLRVFECLSSLGSTLKNVHVAGNFCNSDNPKLKTVGLNMPHLMFLKLHYYTGPLDPILSCINLKEVSFQNCNLDNNGNPSSKVVALVSPDRSLYTNLWVLLPKLKKVLMSHPKSFGRNVEFKRE